MLLYQLTQFCITHIFHSTEIQELHIRGICIAYISPKYRHLKSLEEKVYKQRNKKEKRKDSKVKYMTKSLVSNGKLRILES